MGWLYVPGLGGSNSGSCSRSPSTEPSATSSKKPASSTTESGTVLYTTLQSTETSESLTAGHGEEWTFSLRVSPASPSLKQQPSGEEERLTCGDTSSGSSGRLDLGPSSSRTYEALLGSRLSRTLMACPTMLRLGSFALASLEDRRSAYGVSYLATPTRKANHDSPYMRRWPANKAWQEVTEGRTEPCHWELVMGFPDGWTDCEHSAMPSYLRWQRWLTELSREG